MRIAVALGVFWGLLLSAPVRAQGQDPAVFDGYVTPGPIHRAFFKPGDPGLARLRDAGALKRLEDYRSFVLAVFDERPIGGRDALAALGAPIRDDQAVIGINGAPLDTADEDALDRLLATIPAFLRGGDLGASPSSAATLWIVQFAGPIRDEWLARLQAAGAVIVSPMATNGYVVSVEGAALPSFAAFRDDPAVQWIGAYHPFFRLAPELRALDLSSTKSESVTIQVIDLADGPALVAGLERAFPVRRQTEKVLNLIDVRTSVPANLLPALAAHPFVFAIEPLPGIRKNDEVQGQIIAGNLNAGLSGPSAPGYLSWLSSKGFSSTGQFAFAVDVQDDGIDRGSTTDVSDEFKVLGAGGGLSRVAYQHNYSTDLLADSGDGHGNINASIIAGYNALVGSAWQDANGYAYGLGICPFVQVGATKVFNNAGGPDFLNTNLGRMSAAYASGARFSSNSWGYISGNTYNADSQSFDTLVRDSTTTAGNQEVSIIFSAGNDGSALNTVHPPGTAKNVITVAASENNRQTGLDGCGVGNSGANNAMDIISFSSRGPCSDQRKKPDLTAPGTHIQGGASRSLSYDGGGVCNQYWPNGQTLYCWSSGTSHSCPAIAGASALVRQYFANQSWATPSPAMVKAFLMSSTRHMTGVGANDTLWSNSQGMGLVDLGRAFDSASRVMVDQTQLFGATGQSYVASGTVSSAATPFRVALVWTDAPGPTTGNAWVNNLDLSVTVNGTTYLGNVFTGANSVTGGAADLRNNAEFVNLPAGVSGPFTVTVTATNIAGDGVPGNADLTDQDFALLIYNGTNCSGVSITTQPSGQSACVGSPASFSVVASGAGLTYQWRKNGANVAGATSSTYSIPAVVAGDAGSYDVVVTSGCSVTSNAAALTVSSAPVITVQPSGGSPCVGTSKTFSVTATGIAPISFQWRKDAANIPGAVFSSYVIASVQATDAGTYDVVVTNPCGPTTSAGAALLVTIPVLIGTQPAAQAVCPGAGASFSVAASGTAPLLYQWRKNAVSIGGATSPTYSIASVVAGDAGNYSVVVTNPCGSVTSANAALTLNVAPAITTQPSSATVCQTLGANFSVAASGTAPLTYQWKKNGVDIAGATSSLYSIVSTVPGDAATYSVVVTNACGSATSNGAVLTVNTPATITSQPSGLTVCQGSPAVFTVAGSGTPAPSYQWKKNGVNIAGATSAAYSIASAQPGDAANYSVLVSNGCGSEMSTVAALAVNTAPAINTQPVGATLCEGAAASFSAGASGTAPLSYQWRKNGADIAGAVAVTYAIASTAAADAGTYDVVVTNACGSATSAGAVLVVNVAPAITTNPVASTVCEGAAASFTAAASGTAPLAYQWRKDGAPIGGATAATYAIAAATAAHAGSYDLVVTNACGLATSQAAALSVDSAPAIGTQPAAQAVCEGAGASFSVTASGTAPLAYQWRKDGVALAGATAATHAIASTAAADAGAYDVVVTNGCGSATSGGAVLTVDVVPVIATGPAAATLCEGSPLAFSVTLTRSGAFTYQWRKDGSPIAGATSATYAIAAVTAADAGSYDVTVTSPCGSATSGAAALAVDVAPSITTPPVSATACEGAPVSFTVAASGAAPLLYQWRKDGADIAGAVAATYAIVAMTAADAGSYDVVVTNGCGSATSAAATLASDSVSVTTQPAGQTVCASDPISLSVTAAGQVPLSYQWRRNGADVAGATSSSFAIAAATGADAGSYDVVVTNACGPVTSAAAAVLVGTPAIASLSPPAIAPMAPASPAVTVAVTGSCFVPASVVYANCVALPTTFVDAAHLTCLLGPSIPQTQIPGGLCINVQNTVADVSNSAALIVGSGSNAGTIRRHPLTPAPGQAYSIVMEGAPPFAIFSLFVDFGTVTPVTAFPDPITNLVLAVSPITGSAGPLLTVFDGLGVFGPATGIAFDGAGTFVIPGIILPNPPLGLAVTIQAAYLDPTSPIGLRLNWARFPEEI